MPKAIVLKLQDSIDDLKGFYRASTDAVERRRVQVIWFLAEGKSQQEVVTLTAYNRTSVCNASSDFTFGPLSTHKVGSASGTSCPP